MMGHMSPLSHLAFSLLSFAAVWLSAGALLGVSRRISRRTGRSSFLVSFFLLGLLTSFSEISVAVNSTIEKVPQVSVGNLLGASIVLFLLVAPLLAVIGGRVRLDHDFGDKELLAALTVIAAPAFFAADGRLTVFEGAFLALLYAALAYRLGRERRPLADVVLPERKALSVVVKASLGDILLLNVAAAVIFFSGGQLVREAVYFGGYFSLPPSFFGLLVLAVGTNIPELTIAVRAALSGEEQAAFGDYIGSAALNTLTLGMLTLVNGDITFNRSLFLGSSLAALAGLTLFFVFARSKRTLSRWEGVVLLSLYGVFLAWELWRIA